MVGAGGPARPLGTEGPGGGSDCRVVGALATRGRALFTARHTRARLELGDEGGDAVLSGLAAAVTAVGPQRMLLFILAVLAVTGAVNSTSFTL